MAQLSAKEENKLYIEVVRQMLTLATAGFGLVAALAWNSLIQLVVDKYIKVLLPDFGEVLSLAVYALVVTVFAVLITLQLSKLLRRLEKKDEKK